MDGNKFDGGKPRMDLIPTQCMREIGKVLRFGAAKYGEHNWRKGIDHSRLYAATMRHLTSYWSGETFDPESGLNHLGHAMTNLAMMMETPDYDNRYSNDQVLGAKDGEDWSQIMEIDRHTAMASRCHKDERGYGDDYVSSDSYHNC